jgi:hypothetical protein
LTIGCSKKEDAPPPYTPHVAGVWVGTGTDDSIGFYNVSMTITQSGNSAAGSYDTASSLTNTTGNINLQFGPQGGNNVQSITMSRTWSTKSCNGTATLSQPTYITGNAIAFYYTVTDCNGTNSGGANLHKTIATN